MVMGKRCFMLHNLVKLTYHYPNTPTVPYSMHCFTESYMLAFAESDRKVDFISLLELLDLTKASGSMYISSIFKSLGRLELADYAEKLLQEMRSKGNELYDNKMDTYVILYENLCIVFMTIGEYSAISYSFSPFRSPSAFFPYLLMLFVFCFRIC